MTLDNTAGSAGAARRLEALQAQLDRAVRAARARNAIVLILGVIVLGLLGFYLWYANREFTGWDADRVADYGQSQLVESMPAAATELKRSLREQAPQVIANGEQRLRELPDQFAAKLRRDLGKQLTERAPAAEEQLYEALKAGLAEADKHVAEVGGATMDDEAKFKALLDTLAVVYGTETAKFADRLHGSYKDGSADVIGYLDMLAEGKNLDEQQQSQRTMIRNFLVLAREYHETSTADGARTASLAEGAATTAPTKTVDAPADAPADAPDAPGNAPADTPDAPANKPSGAENTAPPPPAAP